MEKLVKYDTMDRQKGSGRPRTVTTREYEEAVVDLVCSQEDQRVTHMYPRDTAKKLDMPHSFVGRIIKTKDIKQFERLKKPYMNYAARKRREESANVLLETFEKIL